MAISVYAKSTDCKKKRKKDWSIGHRAKLLYSLLKWSPSWFRRVLPLRQLHRELTCIQFSPTKNTNCLWEAVLLLEISRRYISSLWYLQWPVQVCNHEFYIYRPASLESWNIQVALLYKIIWTPLYIPGQASNHVPVTTVSKRKESCECNHGNPFPSEHQLCLLWRDSGPKYDLHGPKVLPS